MTGVATFLRTPSSSLRARLVLLVLAVFVPALLIAAAGAVYVYHEEKKAYRASVRENVRALADVVDRELARREDMLLHLALSPFLDQGALEVFYNLARRITPRWDSVIVLADTDGYQLLNTRRPFPPPEPRVRNVTFPEDRAAFGATATVFSRIYTAQIGRSPSFAVEVPVVRNGKVIYYVAMGSFVSQLQPLIERKGVEGWTIALLDREGTILARNIEPEKHVGQKARPDLLERSRAAQEGFFETKTRDGTPVEAFFLRVPRADWTLAVGLPQSAAAALAWRAAAVVGGSALALLALSVALAAWFGRGIARPVRELAGDAERLGRGEAVASRRTGLAEVDLVSESLARASRQLAQAAAEAERRVAEALARAERSQEELLRTRKLDALGRLTGGIAHDFNNLLQTLSTGLQLVALKPLDSDTKAAVESCRRALDQATRLTRQLSAFAKGQAARPERLDLRSRLLGMTELLRGALRGDIELSFRLADDLWAVELDPMQLELALLNLAINARDAMPEGGSLKVRASNLASHDAQRGDLPAGDYVALELEDSGHGMSAEVLQRAMDPFFTTKETGRGTGLGLAQVYAFSRQAGGGVRVESEPGRGTRIRLYFPRAAAAPASPATVRAAGERARVLFVEDEEMIRDIAAPALRGQGFEVVVAGNAEQALRVLEEQRVDVLFTDIVMPGRYSGIDLADLARQRNPGLAVLLATGYSEQLAAAPRYPVVSKPYDVAQVARQLRSLFRDGGETLAVVDTAQGLPKTA